MNLSPYKISEKFVLNKLNFIQDGKLILENYDGKRHQFGINETTLNAKINNVLNKIATLKAKIKNALNKIATLKTKIKNALNKLLR